jgi:hypothetical protein
MFTEWSVLLSVHHHKPSTLSTVKGSHEKGKACECSPPFTYSKGLNHIPSLPWVLGKKVSIDNQVRICP